MTVHEYQEVISFMPVVVELSICHQVALLQPGNGLLCLTVKGNCPIFSLHGKAVDRYEGEKGKSVFKE